MMAKKKRLAEWARRAGWGKLAGLGSVPKPSGAKIARTVIAAATAALLAVPVLTGCTHNPGDTKNLRQHRAGPVRVLDNGQGQAPDMAPAPAVREPNSGRMTVPIHVLHNTSYVSLRDVLGATGFHGEWLDDGSFGVGDNDPVWRFRDGQSSADYQGENVSLPGEAIRRNDELLIPVAALEKLFGEVTDFVVEPNDVAFVPKAEASAPAAPGDSGDFRDGAEEKPDAADNPAMAHAEDFADAPDAVEAATTANERSSLIAYARRYLGVRYDFGASDYSRSRKFDCSSYTQHIFDRYGVNLPRLARQQAARGVWVPRSALLKGDLLYFYVPGRFKSNRVVGHVGIYMGGGNMIHSSPKPKNGVQITPINKPYWKDTFLYAKRVAF